MKRLREIRNSKRSQDGSRLTIKKCALAVGISERRWINYESGTSEPDWDTACKIANLLGVSLDDLAGRVPA